jgi:hypothetical protein
MTAGAGRDRSVSGIPIVSNCSSVRAQANARRCDPVSASVTPPNVSAAAISSRKSSAADVAHC